MTSSETLQDALAIHALEQAQHAATLGRLSEAEHGLAEVRKLAPKSHHVPLMTAKLRLREGRLDECREALAEAQRLGHDPAENATMSAWLEQHAAQRTAGAGDGTSERKALPASASDAPELERLGTTRDAVGAIAALRRHLQRHPNCPVGLARTAEALAAKARHWGGSRQLLSEAAAHAQRAVEIAPELADGYAALGSVYEVEGCALDAERQLRNAVSRDPGHWFAHYALGAMLARQGRHELALPLLRAALEQRPDYIATYDAVYQARMGLGDSQGAAEVANAGVTQSRSRTHATPGDLIAHAYLAVLFARTGDRAAAEQAVDEMTQRFPKSGSAWAHAAWVYAVHGDAARALEALQTARGRGFDVSLVTRRAEFDAMRSQIGT